MAKQHGKKGLVIYVHYKERVSGNMCRVAVMGIFAMNATTAVALGGKGLLLCVAHYIVDDGADEGKLLDEEKLGKSVCLITCGYASWAPSSMERGKKSASTGTVERLVRCASVKRLPRLEDSSSSAEGTTAGDGARAAALSESGRAAVSLV